MKRLFLPLLLALALFATGCLTVEVPSARKYEILPFTPPIKHNIETGESWAFVNGFWIRIEEFQGVPFQKR